jgi:hypothetical protein
VESSGQVGGREGDEELKTRLVEKLDNYLQEHVGRFCIKSSGFWRNLIFPGRYSARFEAKIAQFLRPSVNEKGLPLGRPFRLYGWVKVLMFGRPSAILGNDLSGDVAGSIRSQEYG